MQLQLCDSHAASGQIVMLSEFHNLPSQNLAPNFKGGPTWRWRGGGGMGLWNNNFFQSQAVISSSHWPDCSSFPENKSTLEEILSLNKNWCVLCPFRCRVFCYSAHGFGLINTNIVFWTQVRRLPSFFRGSSLTWNISPSRCSALCWFIVISSIQSLWKRCNSKFIKACEGGWCLWRRVPGAV